MLKSNLELRSNVYPRDPDKRFLEDISFIHRVRGKEAVDKLLNMLYVPRSCRRRDHPEIVKLVQQGKLTVAQQNSLEWELPCIRCDSIPCGVTFEGHLEFRCDRSDCKKK